MPPRDESGKELGGAEKARRRKLAREEELRREGLRTAPGLPSQGGREFSDLPPAPLGDPLAAMVWWNDVLLVCADKVLRDPVMPLEQRVRFLMDGAAKAGMIRDKSAESKAMLAALAKSDKAKELAGLEPNLSQATPPIIQRPAG